MKIRMKIKKSASLLMALVLLFVSFSPAVYAQESENPRSVVSETPYHVTDEEIEVLGKKDAKVVEYSDGSEEVIFRVPIHANSTRGIASYINVGISGDGNGTITAKMWRLGNLGKINLTMTIYYGTCRIEPANLFNKEKKNITSVGTVLSPTTLSTKISTTKYLAVEITGLYMEQDITYRTYNVLYNKKAVKYPEYTCPVSDKYCVPPYYSNFAKTTSIAWNGRNAYIKWFNNQYSNGKDPWNWSAYEIHHIRPRGYGGDNDYSNLIPLTKAKHTEFTNWWRYYS